MSTENTPYASRVGVDRLGSGCSNHPQISESDQEGLEDNHDEGRIWALDE